MALLRFWCALHGCNGSLDQGLLCRSDFGLDAYPLIPANVAATDFEPSPNDSTRPTWHTKAHPRSTSPLYFDIVSLLILKQLCCIHVCSYHLHRITLLDTTPMRGSLAIQHCDSSIVYSMHSYCVAPPSVHCNTLIQLSPCTDNHAGKQYGHEARSNFHPSFGDDHPRHQLVVVASLKHIHIKHPAWTRRRRVDQTIITHNTTSPYPFDSASILSIFANVTFVGCLDHQGYSCGLDIGGGMLSVQSELESVPASLSVPVVFYGQLHHEAFLVAQEFRPRPVLAATRPTSLLCPPRDKSLLLGCILLLDQLRDMLNDLKRQADSQALRMRVTCRV